MAKQKKRRPARPPESKKTKFFRQNARTFRDGVTPLVDDMFEMMRTDPELQNKLQKSSELRQMLAGYVARAVCTEGRANDPELEKLHRQFLELVEYDRAAALRQNQVIGYLDDVEIYLIANYAANKAAKMTNDQLLAFLRAAYDIAIQRMTRNIETGMQSTIFIPVVANKKETLTFMLDTIVTKHDDIPDKNMSVFRLSAAYGVSLLHPAWVSAYTFPYSVTHDGEQTSSSNVAQAWGQARITNSVIKQSNIAMQHFDDDDPSPEKIATALAIPTSDIPYLHDAIIRSTYIDANANSLSAALEQDKSRVALERRASKLTDQLAERDAEIARLRERAAKPVLAADETKIGRDELDRLRRELDKATRQVEHLEADNADLAARLAAKPAIEFSQEANALRAENETLTRAMEDLLQRVIEENQETTEPSATVADDHLDASILDGLNIIISGGVPIFMQAMEALHPAIRCYDQRIPPDEAIANADMVWIQPANTSHSPSTAILTTCRKLNVPFRFFAQRGINRSKRQLVDEVREFVDG